MQTAAITGKEGKSTQAPTAGKTGRPGASDADKLRLCREELEAARAAFSQVQKSSVEKVVSVANSAIKEIIAAVLGRSGLHGGVKFDLADDLFERQDALNFLPKSLTTPVEVLINMCTSHLGEASKDIAIGLITDACCERLELLISQVSCCTGNNNSSLNDLLTFLGIHSSIQVVELKYISFHSFKNLIIIILFVCLFV